MFKFWQSFESFRAGCDHERYSDFMRRWEANRADFEACSSFESLLQLLSERLGPGEQATIKTDHYLTIKGPDFEYLTRICIRDKRDEILIKELKSVSKFYHNDGKKPIDNDFIGGLSHETA